MRNLGTVHFFILLALAEGTSHGYDINEQMLGDSLGAVYLRSSSLYDALKLLERRGLIELLAGESVKSTRKSYQITELGRSQLGSAGHMYERAAHLTRSRLGPRY